LAEELSRQGRLVLLDGPLCQVRGLAHPVVGYVKTHHRRLLPPQDHDRVAALGAGQRTSLFSVSQRHSCYFRLVCRSAEQHPWFGVVRLEVPGDLGREDARRLADRVCSALPRHAGVAHIDPRAPQNLQAIASLERELRRRSGERALGYRAARAAVLEFTSSREVVRS
ncbi:MAG: hypothetical protein AB1758_21470, partial [Candidatus Eremiobacterota bacterium]